MSDPIPVRYKQRPRRAAPLQPDKPGDAGGQTQPTQKSAEELARAAAEKQREQSNTALENTRDGYA